MLVLRRKCGQSIVIGDDAKIKVKVIRDENGVVSLGVDAPRSILVDRLEIYEKRQNSSRVTNDISCNENKFSY